MIKTDTRKGVSWDALQLEAVDIMPVVLGFNYEAIMHKPTSSTILLTLWINNAPHTVVKQFAAVYCDLNKVDFGVIRHLGFDWN